MVWLHVRKNMKKRKLWIPVLSLSLLLAAGGSYAYLTDTDKTVNEFTIGKVTIDLEEPNWKPEENTKIVPGDDIKKDPHVKNTGTNEAYVYLKVQVPKETVETADDAGNRIPAKLQELFRFSANNKWNLIQEEDQQQSHSYVYAYSEILKPQETTQTLFDTVHFANLIEGQLEGKTLNMPVTAYAIQTKNTGGNQADVPSQAKEAFDKYMNQNTDTGSDQK